MERPGLTHLPSELLDIVLSYLPIYEQFFVFSATNRRLRDIAVAHHDRNARRRKRHSTLVPGRYDGLRSSAFIEAASDRLICAADCSNLICWNPSAGPRHPISHQKISFDTQVKPHADGHHVLVWDNSDFKLCDPVANGLHHPLWRKRLVGNKHVFVSNSGKLVGCLVNNFGRRYAEVIDTSNCHARSNQFWSCGLLSLDISIDDQLQGFVTHEGRAIVKSPKGDHVLSRSGGERAVAIKFSPLRSDVAVCESNREILLFGPQLDMVRSFGCLQHAEVRCCHKIEFDETGDLLLCHAEISDNRGGSHELTVWSTTTGVELFCFSIHDRRVSNFECVGFLPSLSGVLVLLNGSLLCWSFSNNGSPESQPPFQMTAPMEAYITSARINQSPDQSLTLGCVDGVVLCLPLPGKPSEWKLEELGTCVTVGCS